MSEIIKSILALGGTPLPVIFGILGFLCLVFPILVHFFGPKGKRLTRGQKIISVVMGICFMIIGILLYLFPLIINSDDSNKPPLLSESTLFFTSGSKNENGRKKITLTAWYPGKYRLVFENANSIASGCWLIWDYIALKKAENSIWEIGNDDTPPDYSAKAFAEFGTSGVLTNKFIVGQTKPGDFVKEINDSDKTKVIIDFSLDQNETKIPLDLIISTLYSSHDAIPGYKIKLSIYGLK
jgi:hypothetical protein